MIPERIRVLNFLESGTVTGPARISLDFAESARNPEPGLPPVDVTVVSYTREAGETALARATAKGGIPFIEIPERKRWDPAVIPQVRRIVRELKPDILETHNVKSHFFVRFTGLHRQFTWVAWNHGYTSKSRLDRSYTHLDRWSLPGAFRIVTVCNAFAAALEKKGIPADRIITLHNFVRPFAAPPLDEVIEIKQQLQLTDEFVILTVGRMSSEKGHADLLSAIAILDRTPEVPNFRLIMVGDGQEEDNLRRQAASLGIEKRVTMTGFQWRVAPYHAIATVFALPSRSEGSPNAVLEAMAAGLPIAATNVGGVPEILEDDVTSLLVPEQNPQTLAEALLRLLRSEELRLRLGTAAQRKAQHCHTLEAYKRELTTFYLQTLQMRDNRAAC